MESQIAFSFGVLFRHATSLSCSKDGFLFELMVNASHTGSCLLSWLRISGISYQVLLALGELRFAVRAVSFHINVRVRFYICDFNQLHTLCLLFHYTSLT
jgi:hypothetical protein